MTWLNTFISKNGSVQSERGATSWSTESGIAVTYTVTRDDVSGVTSPLESKSRFVCGGGLEKVPEGIEMVAILAFGDW